jgi:hypothetical protein
MAATQNRVLRSGFWTLQGRLPGGGGGGADPGKKKTGLASLPRIT